MSKNFKECAINGGKIVVKRLKGDKTIKICYDPDGKAHASRVEKVKVTEEVAAQPVPVCFTPATKESLEELRNYFNKGI